MAAVIVALGSSCTRPAAPLYEYNRVWQGELRLSDRTLPLRMRVFVLGADREEAATDEWRNSHVFAELEIGAVGTIAATGSASHNDGTARGTVSPYVADREFLELTTSTANAQVDESERPQRGEPYSKRYAALLALFSSTMTLPRAELVFVGELGKDRRLEGAVYLAESGQGACARYVGVECDMWNVRFMETRVGTFSVELDPARVSIAAGRDLLETPSFRFSRQRIDGGGTSWTVRVRNRE